MTTRQEQCAFELTKADATDQPLLEQLLQFYAYDFSELEGTTADRLAFDSHGRFNLQFDLASYWNSPSHWAYLLRVKGSPAGFVLVNARSHVANIIDFNMAEFFVARKYRRKGIATVALQEVLARHLGKWEVAVLEENKTAKSFWPKAIRATKLTRDIHLTKHAGPIWTGPIWTFTSGTEKGHADQ